MDILQAITLGIVQGLTEFAPVSSSAHLVLVPWFLKWDEPSLTFDTTLHLGTLAAVVIYFWRDLVALARAFFASLAERDLMGPTRRLAWLLILGTLPAVMIGALLKEQFEALFSAPGYVGFFLLLTGAVLFLSERVAKRTRDLGKLNWLDALLIGIAQAIAIAPGISRSGATISAGIFRGLEREVAARFSFLLAIPIIFGAGIAQLWEMRKGGVNEVGLPLVLGFLAAAVSGYLVIRFLMSYLQTRTLHVFAAYCWIVGAATLLIFFAGWR